ncbi:ABC transporter ATP-binding protein [Lagierella sp.]|uniref:ABC transporter ATP-binding protein n=1 Tax=Lagierella sp. TaxID=2849657 RepID=UPI002621486C|nr:ABC transporter ATP-binding protein [Lagierella sp.]
MKNVSILKKQLWLCLDKIKFLFLILLFIVSALLFIIAPLFINNVVQNVGKIDMKDILYVILLLAAGYVVQFLAVFLKNYIVQDFNSKAIPAIYQQVFRLSYDEYIELGATALQDLVYNASSSYVDFYLSVMPNLITNIIIILTTIGIAFTLNTLASFLMFITLPIYYFGFKILNNKLSELSVKLRNASSIAFRNINSVISQVDFIKQNPENKYILPIIKENIFKFEGTRKKVNYVANGASGLLSGITQIIQAITIIFLSSLALEDKRMFGTVVYVILILPYFSNAIRELSATNLGFASKDATDKILENLISKEVSEGIEDMPNKIETISLDIPALSIGNKLLLKDIDLTFKQGDIIGIIGESGKGKSTLLKLIPRFREIDTIKINGIDIRNFKRVEYLRKVSYYSQSIPIISDSIYNNLNFGRKPAEKQKYRELSFLDKFENLDEDIIENGANLSGGDKQRIALARYFTEEADLIVLDEPTSSLDNVTENLIIENIVKDSSEKIIFIITHNLDILKYCNKSYKIQDKRLVKEK